MTAPSDKTPPCFGYFKFGSTSECKYCPFGMSCRDKSAQRRFEVKTKLD